MATSAPTAPAKPTTAPAVPATHVKPPLEDAVSRLAVTRHSDVQAALTVLAIARDEAGRR